MFVHSATASQAIRDRLSFRLRRLCCAVDAPCSATIEPARRHHRFGRTPYVQTSFIVFQCEAESIPVRLRLGLHLQPLLGKEGQLCRMGQVPSTCAKKSLDLTTFCGDGRKIRIHHVDNNNYFDRSFLAAQSLKQNDGLRSLIVEDGEVFLLQSRYRISVVWRNYDVKRHLSIGLLNRSFLLRLCRR